VAPFLAGLASAATLPLAVYLTRFSDRYELLHAGFAIPLAAALGILAIALAGRARRRSALRVGQPGGSRLVTAGRLLGILGVGLAVAGLVALGVYGLLEYVGSRE
jgi:heme A synthase